MFNRGGFPGQRPMGHGPMNQPGMNHPGINMSGMNMSGMGMSPMNQPSMNLSAMNQPSMSLSGMNQPSMSLSGMNQPSMGLSGMNQPSMGLSGMNQPNMGLSGMNQPNMSLSGMNQPNMNLSGMNQPNRNLSGMNQASMNLSGMNHPGMNHQRMGHPGISHSNIGLSEMNQPNMNLNRMNHPGMNQGGGMGFPSEMKNQAFGMRPMDNTGSFGGNTDPVGMKGMPIRSPMHTPPDRLMGSQVLTQRFGNPSVPVRQGQPNVPVRQGQPSVPVHQGQPRMPSQNQEIPSIVNRVVTHSSDRMLGKPSAPLQDPAHLMKDKRWENTNVFGNVGQEIGMKSIPSGSSLCQVSNTKNRYTNESASSILESFGLSNEDLEELSRYPDDQLTPSNMPGILRDIRLRKINRPAPDQASGRRSGGEAVPSKVIDYGHSSKYQFNEPATPARSYEAPRTDQKTPPVAKETAAPSNKKPVASPVKGMDNKIPTISGSRKHSWSSSKPDPSNNKTLVGELNNAPVDVPVAVTNVEKSVISIQADVTATPDVAAPVQAELTPAVTVVSGVSQVAYQQPAETSAAGKGSWGPAVSQEDAQKMKKLPTPSMMNDYYAASPRIFPHICSLCNVECRHLKDWIKHQNNSSHIESCRNLRQQYPDWNPQVLSSVRTESLKDDSSSKTSKSKSTSPRRSRRSGSRHRSRKSHSRSPRSSGRRSRSRSPRRSRHSPRRSHSPRRRSRSPQRSRSPRRYRRSPHSNSPDKRAVDAAVQSFIEATKLKTGEKSKTAKPSNNSKKPPSKPSNANVKSKKPGSSAPAPKKSGNPKPASASNSSSASKKPSNGSSSAARKPTSASSSTKKANPGSANSKKPVVSSGAKKTTSTTSSGKIPPSSKPSANRKTPSSTTETSNPLNKFTSKNSYGKIIHVTNLPDSGYTDQDLLKVVQPFGRVRDILIVNSKNEAFVETHFKEAAAAAVKFSESTPVMINNQRVTMSLPGQSKKPVKSADKGGKVKEEPAKASAQKAAPEKKEDTEKKVQGKIVQGKKVPEKIVQGKKVPEKIVQGKKVQEEKMPEKSKHDLEVPPGFVKRYMLDDPPLKQNDRCVVLISNLPEAQYTVDEITNLAKPFGGVNDVLLVANHRKAYLELASRNSVDSMIKYYSVFPTYLSGNLLSICIASRYKDLKDEDLIFADLIEQSSYKITPSIYENFVYLTNLPDKEVEDFEILRVGLRFGKVEHHVYLRNKKKAILHLHSASAVTAMHSFLSLYPCSVGDSVIQCSLPSKKKLAEDEYRTYVEEDIQSPEDNIEQTEPAAAETKEADLNEEKPAEPKDKESEVGVVSSSHGSQSEMDVDATDSEVASAQPPTKDAAGPDTAASAQMAAEPPSSGLSTTCYTMIATEDDDDEDEEEAAEAPEAPDMLPLYTQAEPETQRHEPQSVSEPQVSEELDVLVSVESDEEEFEEPHPFFLSLKRGLQPVPEKETSADKGPKDSPESGEKEATEEAQNAASEPSPSPKPEDVRNKTAENRNIDGQDPSTESSSMVKSKDSSLITTEKESKRKTVHSSDGGSKVDIAKPGEEKPAKGVDESESAASSVAMTRTTKYNAQKGEISVTVTVEGQRSSTKSSESRKRTSRERGTSSHDSSTQRSNSNRSSPADCASSHPKSGSSFSQKKNPGKYPSSQPERDSKDVSRQREREARSSSRKDDRTRGSNSSRYARSSKSNNRSPRSKEAQEVFPFNLDEFVTVDEIVEEHVDSKKKAEKPEDMLDAARKGKRKENEPPPPDTKKSKVTSSTGSHQPSFVTLDEVGDEEENAGLQDILVDQTTPSLVTLDEVHAEDGPSARTKEEQMLMTLDEISDDDDAQDSSTGQPSSTMPGILNKDQLLTLDEVNEEDEEHTTPTEPSKEGDAKLLEDTKDTEIKEEVSNKEPEAKPEPDVQQDPPSNGDEGDHSEQPLLTLDEVKADDDDMSFADIEHQFLTVDEIGEEEEESEEKDPKPGVKSKPSESKDSSKTEPTPSAKRGRPRKRPLPENAEGKDSSRPATPDTSKEAASKKTPAKAKAEEKPGAETPAKKTKVDSPPAEKTTLAPFNSNTAVGLEYLVPKTGYFCELCSLFYMDNSSKVKHCKSLRHYQAVEKHLAKLESEGKSSST